MAIVDFQKHGETARADLLSQFKGKANIEGLLDVVAAQVNELDAALVDLWTERTLDKAVGAQLRQLARIVNVTPGASSDEELRARVRAEIRLNRSEGLIEDVLEVLGLVLGSAASIEAVEIYPASMLVTVLGSAMPELLADLVRRTRAGGVRTDFVYTPHPADETFAFASGDVEEPDAATGWADDAQTTGGRLADALEA